VVDFGRVNAVSLRVLVVDDDAMIRAVLGRMLSRLDVAYDLIGDGRAAVAAAASTRYNLILMDINLPGLDGPRAAREILAASLTDPAPTIVGMTGGVDAELRFECLSAGMSTLLEKPVMVADLARFLGLDGSV
jgi:CheY-like chemotaxis protein